MRWRVVSVTPAERAKPEILNGSRRRRLAKGSGTDIQQVNNLMKQFEDMRKVMRTMNKMSQTKGGMQQMARMMGMKGPLR